MKDAYCIPTMAPPKREVFNPISVAARTMPTESIGYEATRTMSGFVAATARTIGAKSSVEGVYRRS